MKDYGRALTLLAIGASMMLGSTQAFADGKVYPGSNCHPYNAASGNILQRFAQYAENTSNSNSALLTCPVTKDIVGSSAGLSYIRISYTKPSSTGFFCAVYARNATGGGTHGSSEWDFGPAGTKNMILPDISGYGSGSYSLYCILPPGAQIHSYRTDEA